MRKRKDQIIVKIKSLKSALSPLEEDSKYNGIYQYAKVELETIMQLIANARFTTGEDLTGQKFGKLTVLQCEGRIPWSNNSGFSYQWKCQCECGNIVFKHTSALKSGQGSLMCTACKNRERHTTHGKSKDRLYACWSLMIQRCEYENAPSYRTTGANGIKVCDEWREDFINFMEWALENGYAPNKIIHRKDSNSDYSPENCEWINKSKYNITINGVTKTLSQWCREYDISYATARERYMRQWPIEKVFEKNPKKDDATN